MKKHLSIFYGSAGCSWVAIGLLLTALLEISCKKADKAFEQLKSIPELELTNGYIYKGAYIVGDTMVMYGRLNPAKTDFRVKIGDIAAPLLGWKHLPHDSINNAGTLYPSGLDEVKVKITASMGAGEKRPVWITSGGYEVEGPPIDILLTSPDTASFDYELKMTPYYFLPDPNARLFYCVNGKGTIYLYEDGAVKVIRNRRSTPLLTQYTDQFGDFTITTMYAGGVDSRERYLYFSALTGESSTDAANNYIFRLCRYDLESQQLTALNRTLIPKTSKARTMEVLQPFEGAIGQVKMQAATNIYPDSSGNVILNLRQAVTSGQPAPVSTGVFCVLATLQSNGTLKYQYTNGNYSLSYYDAGAGGFSSTRSFPGVVLSNIYRFRVSPDDKVFYAGYYISAVTSGYRVYDLAINDMILDFAPQASTQWILDGPFSSLVFRDPVTATPSYFFGHFPMPGKRLLMLSYFDGSGTLPGRSMLLNFATRYGFEYAPAIDAGEYFYGPGSEYNDEPILNYDEQKHLYIFSQKEREILKTAKR